MALGDNAILPLYRPGRDLTARVNAAILSGKFVKPTGTFEGGPLLDISTPTSPLVGGNNFRVVACVAGDRAVGVTAWDTAADGDKVTLFGASEVVPMVAGANITGGVEVQSDAAGLPITLAAGRSNGIALNTALSGAIVYVKLF